MMFRHTDKYLVSFPDKSLSKREGNQIDSRGGSGSKNNLLRRSPDSGSNYLKKAAT